jgi:hypothetical protein
MVPGVMELQMKGCIMQYQIDYSGHALRRMAQRNFSCDQVSYIIRHGRRIRRTGIIFCFLGGKDIPAEDRRCDKYTRLEGSTVLMHVSHGVISVITVYQNKSALKTIRRKIKNKRVNRVYNRQLLFAE